MSDCHWRGSRWFPVLVVKLLVNTLMLACNHCSPDQSSVVNEVCSEYLLSLCVEGLDMSMSISWNKTSYYLEFVAVLVS